MNSTRLATVSVLLAACLLPGCDDASAAKASAPAAAKASDEDSQPDKAQPEASGAGGKLESLKATIEEGSAFDEALKKVEGEMGESPLQQGEFWNFGEYDSSGACVHMVLVRSGEKVQQVQFTKYQPGSSGYGWCAELKVEKP